MKRLLLKLISIPHALHIKVSPFLNRWYLQAKNISFGKNINIMGKITITGPGVITIGDNFCMTSGAHINPISSNLQGSFFTESTNSKIMIGNNVGMSSTRIWISQQLKIGNNVKVGANVLFIDTDCHPIDYKTRRNSNSGTKSAPIIIEDDVWIGAQSVILKGVTIGARTIIGAGSVVTKDIPADCIAGGNPCKVIRKLV